MVAADAPGGALAPKAFMSALVMKLGALLIPELVTSTFSYSRVAIVAWSAWERSSRGCWLERRIAGISREIRNWVSEPRHGCCWLSIPQRTRSVLRLSHCFCYYQGCPSCQQQLGEKVGRGRAERIPRKLRRLCGNQGYSRTRDGAFIYRQSGDRGTRRNWWVHVEGERGRRLLLGRDSLAQTHAPSNGLVTAPQTLPRSLGTRGRVYRYKVGVLIG